MAHAHRYVVATTRIDPVHVPPDSWLGYLVECACGHGIGRHLMGTCAGDYRGNCVCPLDPSAVLEQAVLVARAEQ
jgi:hypothetical protein